MIRTRGRHPSPIREFRVACALKNGPSVGSQTAWHPAGADCGTGYPIRNHFHLLHPVSLGLLAPGMRAIKARLEPHTAPSNEHNSRLVPAAAE